MPTRRAYGKEYTWLGLHLPSDKLRIFYFARGTARVKTIWLERLVANTVGWGCKYENIRGLTELPLLFLTMVHDRSGHYCWAKPQKR